MEQIKNISLRPTYAEIELSNLEHNLTQIKNLVGEKRVMPILKANSYGHGMIPIAKFLEKKGYNIFGVAFLEEGIALRNSGITSDILVLGGLSEEQIPFFFRYDIIATASSIDKLKKIDEYASIFKRKGRVHLKIDTGMERIGVHYYNSEKFFFTALNLKNIEIEGVYSHFANADDNIDSTKIQFDRFLNSIKYFDIEGLKTPTLHIANSAAILTFKDSHLDMVRPGISMYGYFPNPDMEQNIELKPLLSLKSKIVYFKVVEKGATISYGSTWISPKLNRVVTIPIGYGDGYSRALSNRGYVLIRGKKYPIVGRVCMDQLMVNIGWDEAFNGEEVVLIGSQSKETISCDDLATIQNTISYEILTNINTRVPRIYLYNGSEIFF
ncbi:alanine racemase [bacterium]|nr:alanine racemase [bacterium]